MLIFFTNPVQLSLSKYPVYSIRACSGALPRRRSPVPGISVFSADSSSSSRQIPFFILGFGELLFSPLFSFLHSQIKNTLRAKNCNDPNAQSNSLALKTPRELFANPRYYLIGGYDDVIWKRICTISRHSSPELSASFPIPEFITSQVNNGERNGGLLCSERVLQTTSGFPAIPI